MQLRVLGAHNMESNETRLASYLMDGVLALDAGGLTRSLSFPEQKSIKAIILSHRHFDHVRDLLPLGLFMRNAGLSIDLHAMADTAEFLTSNLFNGSLYPNFLKSTGAKNPVYRFKVFEFHKEFKVLDYTVVAVPVPHAVPAAGVFLHKDDRGLFYTGDTGRGFNSAWKHIAPDTLLTEVTFGNENKSAAHASGHLTPSILEQELRDFHDKLGYFPKVVVSHMSPLWEEDILTELKQVSDRLGIEIIISYQDMLFDI